MSRDEAGIIYVNRKGYTYYLCEIVTKTGKCRYAFARKPTGRAIFYLPEGYEIIESPNGVVSLRKIRQSPISSEEVQAVVRRSDGIIISPPV